MLRRLLAEGHDVRALVRSPEKAAHLAASGVELVNGDVIEGSGLGEGLKGCDAAIHLVGIIVENGNATFEQVHHHGTRNVAEAASRNGIRRFVQMSALGVRPNSIPAYQPTHWTPHNLLRHN